MWIYTTIICISFIGLFSIAYFQTKLATSNEYIQQPSNRTLYILFGCIIQAPLLGLILIGFKNLFFM